MKRIVIIVLILLVMAFAIIVSTIRLKSDRPDSLRVSGNIEITSSELSFKLPGRVKERLVDEGQAVSNGQIVARLEDDELKTAVALRNAQLENARQVLAELEAGSRKEEISQAEAALARAEAEANRFADDYRRQKALFEKEVISQQKFDAARAAYDVSRAQARETREFLALVRKGPRKERIAQARARLQEAIEALNEAKTRLSFATLVSPVGGLVMAKNIEPGEQVNAGTPVVTIGDISNTWLRAYIPETDLGRAKVGQKVVVTTDTYKDKRYEGRVTFIASEAEFTPKNVQTDKERVKLVYRIKITIPNPKMELKPGMPADAEIMVN